MLIARDWDLALALAERVLFLNPNSADGWSLSGWANFNCGNGSVAIEHFERSLRLSPTDHVHVRRSGIGWGHFLEERYDEAVRWADAALQAQPRWATALRCKVSALGLAGRAEEAAKAARALLELQPGATIRQFRTLMPLKRPEHMARYLDGLRKAGIAE